MVCRCRGACVPLTRVDGMKCPYCKGTGEVQATIASRAFAARQDKNWTQQKASGEIGIGRAQLANIETGRTDPSIKTLLGMASAYDVTTDWLLGQ